MMPMVAMTVNGRAVRGEVKGRTLLVEFLREHLHLTGTHVGCDTTQCGACVVHVNGMAMKSCTMLALQCEGAAVITIEGLAPPGTPMHPMQAAFREHHALQCGYCTSGMVMIAQGQHLPLHRLSQHRQGDCRRRPGHGGDGPAVGAFIILEMAEAGLSARGSNDARFRLSPCHFA
jgi:aerobic carbon-monoxide dehydrogenase small subunit